MVTLILFILDQLVSGGAGSREGDSWIPPSDFVEICKRRVEEEESLAEG